MGGSISLKAYAVRMNKKGYPDELVFENQIVHEVLSECLNELTTPTSTSGGTGGRVFSQTSADFKFVSGANRRVSGVLKAGTSGYTSEIIGKTGKVAFNRTVNHTEVIPYYFQASIPIADRAPIVCMQQFSGNGLYLFFTGLFMERLKARLSRENLRIQFNPIFLSGLYMQRYVKDGVVKKITAIAHRVSADTADGTRQARISSEILLSPIKRKDFIATLQELVTREGQKIFSRKAVYENVQEIFELDVDAEDIKELIIEAEVGGVKRTISVGEDFGTAFDISNDVARDRDGHPDREGLDVYVTDFISKSLRPYYEA